MAKPELVVSTKKPGLSFEDMKRPKGVDLRQEEFDHGTFVVLVPDETPQEFLTDSAFWFDVADKLSIRTELKVQPYNGRWLAHLFVQFVDRHTRYVQVALLQRFDLPEVHAENSAGISEGWSVRWINTKDMFGAFLNNTLVKDGFANSGLGYDFIRGRAAVKV